MPLVGLSQRMTAAHMPLPPLVKTSHRRVVQGHFSVNAPDLPTPRAHAEAQVRFLSRNHFGREAFHFLEGLHPHQRVTPAGLGQSYGRVPFDVAESVVDAGLGKAFPTAT